MDGGREGESPVGVLHCLVRRPTRNWSYTIFVAVWAVLGVRLLGQEPFPRSVCMVSVDLGGPKGLTHRTTVGRVRGLCLWAFLFYI